MKKKLNFIHNHSFRHHKDIYAKVLLNKNNFYQFFDFYDLLHLVQGIEHICKNACKENHHFHIQTHLIYHSIDNEKYVEAAISLFIKNECKRIALKTNIKERKLQNFLFKDYKSMAIDIGRNYANMNDQKYKAKLI